MKFTPTAKFLAIANGGSKLLVRKVYVRKTTDLTLALTDNSVPWIDVTNKVMSFPELESRVELDVGIPVSQSAEFEFFGVAWWKANIFNATASQYIEIKVEEQIGLNSSDLATDINYAFSGYLDKNYIPDNNSDSLTVTARSLDDLLSTIIGETFTTQVLDVSGYLTLLPITGISLSDANVTSYVLKEGVHTISYEYTDEKHHAKLDDGEWVELAAGANTLLNLLTDPVTEVDYTDQKVTINVDMTSLSYVAATCDIIVTAAGTTIPKTWYNHIWVRSLLKLLYTQVGLTSCTLDDFKIATFDGRSIPTFWDVPPGDSFYALPNVIAYDATNNRIWVGVKDRVYYKNLTTHEYTLCGTITSGYTIVRLWGEDAGSGFIWGVAKNSAGAHKIVKVIIATPQVLSYAITRTLVSIDSEQNFALDLGIRGIFYGDQTNANINIFFLDTVTEGNFSATDFIWTMPAYADGTGKYYTFVSAGPTGYVVKRYTYSGGSLTMSSTTGAFSNAQTSAVYCAGLGLWIGKQSDGVYKWSPSIEPAKIDTDVLPYCFCADETHDYVYWMVRSVADGSLIIKKYDGSSVTTVNDALSWDFANGLEGMDLNLNDQLCYDSTLDRLVGISYLGYLFEYGTNASMYIQTEVDLEGGNLRDALNEILKSYLLVNIISNAKSVIVKRRIDDTGAHVSSGNSVSLTNYNVESLTEENLYSRAVAWISVSNGKVTHSYDGTTWDNKYFGTGRKMELTCKYIPDNVVEDIAYYLYRYFKDDHNLYPIPLANILPLQMECLDAAALAITSKISKTATGIIYGVKQAEDSQLIFEVLV